MKFVKPNDKKKLLVLLLLSFGMIFASIDFSSLNFPWNFNSINNEENTNIEDDLDHQIQIPKTSDHQNFNGFGQNLIYLKIRPLT